MLTYSDLLHMCNLDELYVLVRMHWQISRQAVLFKMFILNQILLLVTPQTFKLS